MSAAEALPIVRQMTAALDAAHRAGITHRDFKSANVMLVPQAGMKMPSVAEELRASVVMDFGLARSAAGLE
jgi:serine/threonine protein kinase